jgi:hypothetical protein
MLTSYDVGAVGDEESRMLRELVANLSFALQTCTRKTKFASCRISIR